MTLSDLLERVMSQKILDSPVLVPSVAFNYKLPELLKMSIKVTHQLKTINQVKVMTCILRVMSHTLVASLCPDEIRAEITRTTVCLIKCANQKLM